MQKLISNEVNILLEIFLLRMVQFLKFFTVIFFISFADSVVCHDKHFK